MTNIIKAGQSYIQSITEIPYGVRVVCVKGGTEEVLTIPREHITSAPLKKVWIDALIRLVGVANYNACGGQLAAVMSASLRRGVPEHLYRCEVKGNYLDRDGRVATIGVSRVIGGRNAVAALDRLVTMVTAKLLKEGATVDANRWTMTTECVG